VNEQVLQKCIDEWQAAMKQTEYFSLDKTTPDKISELWDRLATDFDCALGSDIKRVDMTLSILDELGALRPNTIAIDIGCGTGSFTLELAKRCRKLYALDISQKMLDELNQKAEKSGITNIVCINGDWRSLCPSDFDPEINLTLSCLNTGINDFESLDKMSRISKGWNCYITVSGRSLSTQRSELQEIVFGRTLKNAGGNDIIFPFNIIYHMGYAPQLHYVPCRWSRSLSRADALGMLLNDFSRYKDIDTKTAEKLEEYVESNLNEDGMYSQSANTLLGLMTWKSKRL